MKRKSMDKSTKAGTCGRLHPCKLYFSHMNSLNKSETTIIVFMCSLFPMTPLIEFIISYLISAYRNICTVKDDNFFSKYVLSSILLCKMVVYTIVIFK